MDVDEATPSQIVESSMSLSGTSELVAFTVDPSDEELFISFKFGSKIGAGREYVVFSAVRDDLMHSAVVRCIIPRSGGQLLRGRLQQEMQRAIFGAHVDIRGEYVYQHLVGTWGFSTSHPSFHFLTMHPKFKPLDKMLALPQSEKILAASSSTLAFYISLTRVLLQTLIEIQDFKRLPRADNLNPAVLQELVDSAPETWFVLHNDVKPGNLFYDAARRKLRLGDYGSLMVCEKSTELPTVFHTEAFAAPEQRDGLFGFPSSDVYSVAKTVLCVGGRIPPHGGENQIWRAFNVAQDHPWIKLLQIMLQSEPRIRPTPEQAALHECFKGLSIEEADKIVSEKLDSILQEWKLAGTQQPEPRSSAFRKDVGVPTFVSPGDKHRRDRFNFPTGAHSGLSGDADATESGKSDVGLSSFNSQLARERINRQHKAMGDDAIRYPTKETDPQVLEGARAVCRREPLERIGALQAWASKIMRYTLIGHKLRDVSARLALCCMELTATVPASASALITREKLLEIVHIIIVKDSETTEPINPRELKGGRRHIITETAKALRDLSLIKPF